jgi:hypothetical protein
MMTHALALSCEKKINLEVQPCGGFQLSLLGLKTEAGPQNGESFIEGTFLSQLEGRLSPFRREKVSNAIKRG